MNGDKGAGIGRSPNGSFLSPKAAKHSAADALAAYVKRSEAALRLIHQASELLWHHGYAWRRALTCCGNRTAGRAHERLLTFAQGLSRISLRWAPGIWRCA